MPICITVELWDKWSIRDEESWQLAKLEHFTIGSVQSIGKDLERRVKDVRDAIKLAGVKDAWTGQEVAGLMVKLSAKDDGCGGMPTFRPCLEIDRGCEYVWRIFLASKDSQHDIRCFETAHDHKRDRVLIMKEVDWKARKRV